MSISVIITCHNYGRYLRECLESVLAQERRPDEIVVVDDASSDETPAIAATYAPLGVRYERVEYRDACQSYNHGIAATRGDLLAFVDADNALTPRFLATLAARLDTEPEIAFAYSDRFLSGEASVAAWAEIGAQPDQIMKSFPPDPAMLAHRNFIDTTAIVRRAVVDALGGFRTLPALWDYRFWLTAIEAGYRGSYVAEPLYHYRIHASNMILGTRPQHRGLEAFIRREHFGKSFWAPYLQPEVELRADVIPGQSLPGGTPCHLLLTPQIVGVAYPSRLRIEVVLPSGVEYLAAECDWRGTRFTVAGERITALLTYPVPDGAAAAVAPTIRLAVIARQAESAPIRATLTWNNLLEHEQSREETIALPALAITPPLQLALAPGGIQRVSGQFAPGELVGAWAAMPPDAPTPSVPLPGLEADSSGTIYADCRLAPQGFAAIVLQGEAAGVQVVFVPADASAVPPALATQGATGRRIVASLRRRIAARRRR